MSRLDQAACFGEDPRLFDVKRYPEAWPALTYCARCPITQLCIDIVRPSKSHYDGVCGGVVWSNGYRVRTNNTTREESVKRAKALRESSALPGMDGVGALPQHGSRRILSGAGKDLRPRGTDQDDLSGVPEQGGMR